MKLSLRNGALALILALGATACGDLPTTPSLEGDDPLLSRNGTAPAEHVLVGGSVVVTIEAGEPQPILVAAGETVHPQGLGYCLENGAWVNSANNNGQPSAAPHQHCIAGWTSGSFELELTFGDYAAVLSNSGKNQNLNFKDLDDTFVHYNGNRNTTTGQGVLAGTDDHGGDWTLDLAQVSGTGNLLDRTGTPVQVCNDLYGCVEIMITW